jgi:hypothetical protein
MHRFNAIKVYNGRTIHPKESFGRKLGFEVRQCFPQNVIYHSDMQNRVVGGGFDVVHVGHFDKSRVFARFYCKSSGVELVRVS